MEATQNNKPRVIDFIDNWKDGFIDRINTISKSKKQDFTYYDAVKRSKGLCSELDKVMIEYFSFIRSDPLQDNDFYKYLDSYINGKKLKDKYFRHDLEVLRYYEEKADKNKDYNPFHIKQYETYVLFMMLKFSDQYLSEYDSLFNIKFDEGREYSPLCHCPTHIRAELPIDLKEYDISRAYPTFIFLELKMKPFDVYEKLSKKAFNTLLNINSETKGAKIENVRDQLRPIYGDRVNEVITENRFYNKG